MSRIVEAARGWIGTPYRHQAQCKGAGCDCLGLLLGVWRETCGALPETVPAYTRDWSEPQGEERLWRAATRWLVEKSKDDEAPGDVVLFRMRMGGVAKHLGIVGRVGPVGQDGQAAAGTFIHAYSGHAVAESPLSTPWRRRIVARFEFPKEF